MVQDIINEKKQNKPENPEETWKAAKESWRYRI